MRAIRGVGPPLTATIPQRVWAATVAAAGPFVQHGGNVKDGTKAKCRAPYERPAIRELGTLSDLTLGAADGPPGVDLVVLSAGL
ncbi:MAG: lasso RiPP family leader peptide-containing protein [Actinomycetota bacterium]